MDVEEVSSLITQKLENMIEAGDRVPIIPKHLAICVLLPYAIFLGKGGRREMVNSIFRAAKVSGTCWFIDPVGSYITMLLGKPSSPFLDWLITLASPQIDWESNVDEGYTVVRWAAAALAVPDAEEVSQSVVDTLLQISSIESLRPHIPIKIWAWLKKRPSLPPVCLGRRWGTTPDTVRHVRGLRDPEILKSYFLLVWSEWDELSVDGLDEMGIVISEEFGGIGMWNHREDLIKRLDDVLERLDLGLEYLEQHNPRVKQHHIEAAQGQYGRLKEVLLRVDREAVNVLARKPHDFVLFNERTDYHERVQNLVAPSFVRCPFRVCDNRDGFFLCPHLVISSLSVPRFIAFHHFLLALLGLSRSPSQTQQRRSLRFFTTTVAPLTRFLPFLYIMTRSHCNNWGFFHTICTSHCTNAP